MLEKDKANIHDCLTAIEKIKGYVKGISTADELYERQETYDATLMNFLVIAEACKRISDEVKDKNNFIDWKGISGFRNFLAHDYFGIDANEEWPAIKHNLPELKEHMKKMLKEDETTSGTAHTHEHRRAAATGRVRGRLKPRS